MFPININFLHKLVDILGGGASNSNAASQSFNTGINIPGIFGARFGASNAAANAGSAGIGGGGLGASNSNAAAQSVGAGINVLGIDLGWNAANSASHSGGGFLGR